MNQSWINLVMMQTEAMRRASLSAEFDARILELERKLPTPESSQGLLPAAPILNPR